MHRHRTLLPVVVALIATAWVAPSATAVLLPGWRPPGYRLVSQGGSATGYYQTFRRAANKIEYTANYRRCYKAPGGSPVHRIRVPSWCVPEPWSTHAFPRCFATSTGQSFQPATKPGTKRAPAPVAAPRGTVDTRMGFLPVRRGQTPLNRRRSLA